MPNGQQVRDLPLVGEAERVADRDARLLHRGRGERREADDVARRVDARGRSCGSRRRPRRSRACRPARRAPRARGPRSTPSGRSTRGPSRRRSRAPFVERRDDARGPPRAGCSSWSARGGTSRRATAWPRAGARRSRRRGTAGARAPLDERDLARASPRTSTAYSQPMTPPPTTSIVLGQPVESAGWCPSRRCPGRRRGCRAGGAGASRWPRGTPRP